MADANNHIIYSLADIQRYLQGGMSTKEMHDMERAALEDPFLSDALEGYAAADLQQAKIHLSAIDTAIRAQQKQKVVPLIPLNKYSSWRVAAAILILVCISGICYFIFDKKTTAYAVAENKNDVAPLADSTRMPSQVLAPPITDSAFAATKKKATAQQDNTALASNQKTKAERPDKIFKTPAQAAPAQAGISEENAARLNTIAIRAADNTIAGTITNNHQQPVPNAMVTLQDSTQAITDRNGNFQIHTSDSLVVANITAFGYKPLKDKQLTSIHNQLMLQEKPFILADVEVINIGSGSKQKYDTAAVKPEGGWQSFRQYVYEKLNRKYDSTALQNAYISGDVQLEFSINEDGIPIDFKVLQSPDTQVANEAISAIKTGPKWINTDKQSKMRIRVKY